jgi:hypothetical protein
MSQAWCGAAVHTRDAADFHWDFFDRDGGGLNSSALRLDELLVPLAKRGLLAATAAVLETADEGARAPLRAGELPPIARVDLACCLEEDDELAANSGGWFVNEIETAPDSCMTYFLRMLVDTIDHDPRYEEDERMRGMVARAAAAWYPMAERIATEFAKFALTTAARR